MADTGLRAHEYEQAAKVARQFTQNLLAVKRGFYNLPGVGDVPPQEMAAKQRNLAAILTAIGEDLSVRSQRRKRSSTRTINMPYQLVRRIERSKRGVLPRFLEDLEKTSNHLEADPKFLTEEDIRLLDDLGQLLDAETSAAFRKLLRR